MSTTFCHERPYQTASTYRLELIIRVGDARRLELRAEVVGCDDVASDAAEQAGARADQEAAPGDWRRYEVTEGHFVFGHGPLVTQMVHDHVEFGDDSSVMCITASVDLCEHKSSFVGPALSNEPAGRLGSEVSSEPPEPLTGMGG